MKMKLPQPGAATFLLASASMLTISAVFGSLMAQPPLPQSRAARSGATSQTSYGAEAGKIADEVMAALKSLNLSDAQKAQLKAIGAKYAPQVRAVATDKSLTKEQKSAQLTALRLAARAEASAVLTPPQQAKLKGLKLLVEGQVTALLTEIGQELDLTDVQKQEIKSILADARIQAAAIISDPSLSRLQKRTQLQALAARTRHDIAALLTGSQPDQLEAIAKQIRDAVQSRVQIWRNSGGLGFGLMA